MTSPLSAGAFCQPSSSSKPKCVRHSGVPNRRITNDRVYDLAQRPAVVRLCESRRIPQALRLLQRPPDGEPADGEPLDDKTLGDETLGAGGAPRWATPAAIEPSPAKPGCAQLTHDSTTRAASKDRQRMIAPLSDRQPVRRERQTLLTAGRAVSPRQTPPLNPSIQTRWHSAARDTDRPAPRRGPDRPRGFRRAPGPAA